MLKLFAYAGFTVHAFSCIYWRVKIESSDADSVALFLNSHDVDSQEVMNLKLKQRMVFGLICVWYGFFRTWVQYM